MFRNDWCIWHSLNISQLQNISHLQGGNIWTDRRPLSAPPPSSPSPTDVPSLPPATEGIKILIIKREIYLAQDLVDAGERLIWHLHSRWQAIPCSQEWSVTLPSHWPLPHYHCQDTRLHVVLRNNLPNLLLYKCISSSYILCYIQGVFLTGAPLKKLSASR